MLLAVGIGAALGFVCAQLMYLWVQQSSSSYQAASAAGEGSLLKLGDQPRSELERILWEKATPKPGRPPEVMIAISDHNLVATGALVTWIKVRGPHPPPPRSPGTLPVSFQQHLRDRVVRVRAYVRGVFRRVRALPLRACAFVR